MKTTTPVATSLQLPDPAPGAEFAIFPTAGSTWVLTGLTHDFTTSAAVANRTPVLSLENGSAQRLLRIPWNALIAASATRRTSYYPGAAPGAGVQNEVTLPLPIPGIIIRPGWVLRSRTGAIDVGDQYANICVSYVELYPASSEALAPGGTAQLVAAGQSV